MSEVHAESEPSSRTPEERARALREALVGTRIADRYVLRALIGHGGMGAVYEAEHLGIGKRVAIKFVDPEFATDERVVARFAREARVMSFIESAHIVSVFDAGTHEKRPYLVMELLRGEDLGQRLRRMNRIPVREAMHIVAQVLKGLAKAHAASVVHRDLKPDNVFLVKTDTDPIFTKIVDFGVSKIERPRNKTSPLALTGRGTVLGTPFYMAPEQAQAAPDVDARADLYSVGAILFECLSGRPPHTGETYEQIILSICMQDAPNLRAIVPTVPREIAAFVDRALTRDKVQRYASAERMLAALHEIAPEEKVRVPLDAGAPATLLSAGIPSPNEIALNERQAASERAPATPPASTRSPPSSSVAGVPSRRFTTRVVATAIGATLLGLGITLAILSALDKGPVPARVHRKPAASAHGLAAGSSSPSASASPSLASPTANDEAPSDSAPLVATPVATSLATSIPATTSSSAAAPKPAVKGPSPVKPSSTKLDIARDLP